MEQSNPEAGPRSQARRLPAHLQLGGHASTEAELELVVSRSAWALRAGWYFVHWIGATAVTGVLTVFDPHVLILPLLIGGAWFFQAWKRRYRAVRFEGRCPRCAGRLTIKPGTWITLPHGLDCFECHFEPELHLGAVAKPKRE